MKYIIIKFFIFKLKSIILTYINRVYNWLGFVYLCAGSLGSFDFFLLYIFIFLIIPEVYLFLSYMCISLTLDDFYFFLPFLKSVFLFFVVFLFLNFLYNWLFFPKS